MRDYMRLKFEINVKIYIYIYVSCKMFIININTLRKLRKYLNN